MVNNDRLEMLLNELGDTTPRHVGGVSGGHIAEGWWAAQQIVHYGLDAVLPLAARLRLVETIENGDMSVLAHFGFRDRELAKNWVITARANIRYALYRFPEIVEHLQKSLLDKEFTIRAMSALALGYILEKNTQQRNIELKR